MPLIRMTRDLAQRASWDAANRSMRAGNRKVWNEDDAAAADRQFDRLWSACAHGVEPQNCCYCFETLDEKGRRMS